MAENKSSAAPAGTVSKVVLVGHCGADSASLEYSVRAALGKVTVVNAHDVQSTEQHSGPESLLLVNRALEYGFGVESGIELIQSLARKPGAPRMMLVSNYAESQAQAVAAGALPGFGKAQMHTPATAKLLREAAGLAAAKR